MADQVEITLSRDRRESDISCTIHIKDPKLIGHQAHFSLIAEVKVDDKRAVNGKKTLFESRFNITGSRTLTIPGRKFRAYSYKGNMIDVRIHTVLKVDDAILFDTKISQQQELAIGAKPAVKEDVKQIIEPGDAFQFFANLRAIPYHNQIITLGLTVLGGIVMIVNALIGLHDQFVPESMTWVYSHYDASGEGKLPAGNALAGSCALGAAIWFAMRSQLRKYMTFRLATQPKKIRRGDRLSVPTLIGGKPRVSLHDVTLRIVAANMECGQYTRGSGSNQRTVSFKEPIRGVVLYEKTVTLIPKGSSLKQWFDGEVDFEPMFRVLFPPYMVTSNHGLDTHWEIQLLHPEFVDQELIGPGGVFEYEDFLDA